ncbi:tetratricopeptide repeat protein [Paludisphaera mucosa]|uniref:Tetratricopeptide repeat protein n=1 Tax=Paludisphaera mucosa TaxID=3030827 RepID=A0ABT6FDV1_9BACT|nr:tetratricopeptide repeat protein [Paludisphaera mucosa]MDG3005748.1 tetratricopeptide repeat protein [Paludisphaera mucosa]
MNDLERAPRPNEPGGRLRPTLILMVASATALFLLFLAWEFGPPRLTAFWASVGRSKRRAATAVFLNGVLAGYVLVWIALLAGVLALLGWIVAARPSIRGAARRWTPRLLLLGLSTTLGLAGLEATSALWAAWLHRSPTASAPALAVPPRAISAADSASQADVSPVRILVIGESSARGEPYNPWLSVGQIVGWQLESVLPGRRVEVEVWATGGATLESAHQQLAGLTYRPDLLILFSGHNEFQARYAWSRNPPYYLDEFAARPERDLVERLLRRSPFCGLVLETLDRQRVDLVPEAVVTRQLVDRPTCTADEADSLLADFERRLEAIASYAETLGTQAVFVVPASNDGGFEPSRSFLPVETPREAREAFAGRFGRIRDRETADPAAAAAGYRELIREQPGFAESHFRLARLLEREGRFAEARDHFVAAREADGTPLRCPQAFRMAYHDTAERHPGLILLDGPRILEAASAHGILDDRLFHDAQHPTFRGYLALAQGLLEMLRDRRALGWPEAVPTPTLDPDAAARHFRLDAARWAEVCRRSALFYQVTAFIRFDPSERLEHQRRYLAAEAAVKDGRAPEEAGVSGLGVHPDRTP